MKKSQAAMEFLVTYGWAILAVLIVIAALAYFGLFNTSVYVQDECNFGDQLHCEDAIMRSDGWLSIQLRNNFPVPIDISSVTVKSDFGSVSCPRIYISKNLGSNPVTINSRMNIQPGELFEVNCEAESTVNIPEKEKFKANLVLVFSQHDSGAGTPPLHNQTGDVITTVTIKGTCSDNVRDCHDALCETGVDLGC